MLCCFYETLCTSHDDHHVMLYCYTQLIIKSLKNISLKAVFYHTYLIIRCSVYTTLYCIRRNCFLLQENVDARIHFIGWYNYMCVCGGGHISVLYINVTMQLALNQWQNPIFFISQNK